MNEFSKTLQYLMDQKNLSDSDLADMVGVNRSTIVRWRSGIRSPKLDKIPEIAAVLGVDPKVFIGKKDSSNNITLIYNQLTQPRKDKVYVFAEKQLEEQNKQNDKVVQISDYVEETMNGYLSAGTGEYLTEEVHEKIKIPIAVVPEQDYDLVLQVNGDSMQPMFEDHEYVFIKKTNEIRSGQIGVFIIDGESYLKKVYIEDSHLRLVSLNKKYADLRFNDMNDIKLVGRVVL